MRPAPGILGVIGVSAIVAVVVTNFSLFIGQNGADETAPSDAVTAQTTTPPQTTACPQPSVSFTPPPLYAYSWVAPPNPKTVVNVAALNTRTRFINTNVDGQGQAGIQVVTKAVARQQLRNFAVTNAQTACNNLQLQPALCNTTPGCRAVGNNLIVKRFTPSNVQLVDSELDEITITNPVSPNVNVNPPAPFARVRYELQGECVWTRRCSR